MQMESNKQQLIKKRSQPADDPIRQTPPILTPPNQKPSQAKPSQARPNRLPHNWLKTIDRPQKLVKWRKQVKKIVCGLSGLWLNSEHESDKDGGTS